jgi:hypothetical protein
MKTRTLEFYRRDREYACEITVSTCGEYARARLNYLIIAVVQRWHQACERLIFYLK